jgi:hypothetical protein
MYKLRNAIGFTVLSALIHEFAVADETKQRAELKRPPWDTRPPKCFISPEVMRLSPNCVAEPDWPSFSKTISRVRDLFVYDDYALLAWAEKELGFSDEKFPSGEYRFEAFNLTLVQQFSTSDEYTKEMLEKWRAANPDQGYAKLAEALMLYNNAWEIRGGGYANTVNPEAWRLFYNKLAEANEVLDNSSPQLKKMGPWYLLKLKIANQHPELKVGLSKLFDDATTSWPDFLPIYTQQMEFAKPKWGGSFEKMELVAQFAYKKTSEKLGASMYARSYERVFIQPESYTLRDSKVDWNLMKQGFRDIESQKAPTGMWKNFAALACQMRDQKEALRLYQLHDRTNPNNFGASDPCRNFALSGLIKS